MPPHEIDAEIRAVLEERSSRPSAVSPAVEPVGLTEDAYSNRPGRFIHAVLLACVAVVALLAGLVVVGSDNDGEDLVASDVPSESESFEPDLSELPPPKWYAAGSTSGSGNGTLVKPDELLTEEELAASTPERQASTIIVEWYEAVTLTSRANARTRMSWSIPSQGGWDPGRDLERSWPEYPARFVEDQVDGMVFQVATNDVDVTRGQIQALLERMVRQYQSAKGEEPNPPSSDPEVRLTAQPSELPEFPSTAELEAQFDATGEADRLFFSSIRDRSGPLGYVLPERAREAFPVFDLDGTLQGIYVSGMGVVPRGEYEDPNFDPEGRVSERF